VDTSSLITPATTALYRLESQCGQLPWSAQARVLPLLDAAKRTLRKVWANAAQICAIDQAIEAQEQNAAVRKALRRANADFERANADLIALHVEAALEKASVVPVAVVPVSDKRQAQLAAEAELKARMIAERRPPPCAAATEEHFHVAHWAGISGFKNVRRINAATKEEAKRDTRGIIPRGTRHISYQIAESAWQRIYARLRKKQKGEPQASPKAAPSDCPSVTNA
jgi:hypothetical protein